MTPLKLLAFPFSGGTSYSYRDLQARLAPDFDVMTFEMPGHGKRIGEPMLKDVRGIVAALWKEWFPSPSSPFALFGHSLGALTAYEFARLCRDEGGAQPVALIVSGKQGPSFTRSAPPRHLMARDAFFAELRRLGGSAPEVLENDELMDLFEPILRADFEAADTYKRSSEAATEPLEIPITVLRGLDDDVAREDARRWEEETTEGAVFHDFPGGHFFLQERVDDVAAIVKATLLRVPARALVAG
jgi:surfactin synthase thioesterase subunit